MPNRKVSKDEFYRMIGPRDVQPRITNDKYPYTSVWIDHATSSRPVIGKTVGRIEGGKLLTDYFLA